MAETLVDKVATELEKTGARVIRGGDDSAAQITIPVELPDERRAPDDALRLLIERIERLEEEKKGIADDIRDVFGEAKSRGYDVKVMRFLLKLRRMETHTRQEWDAVLETYRAALGLA